MTSAQRVVACMSGVWLEGALPPGPRLAEVLRDRTTHFLRLTDCRVYGPFMCHANDDVHRQMMIAKDQILFAAIQTPNDDYLARRGTNPVRRIPTDATVMVDAYLIDGSIHLNRACTDPLLVITSELQAYFAISDATVHSVGGVSISFPVAFINRNRIGSFSIDKQSKSQLESSVAGDDTVELTPEELSLKMIQELLRPVAESMNITHQEVAPIAPSQPKATPISFGAQSLTDSCW